MGRTKAIGKVGLIATKEHNRPYKAALRKLGYKVIELDGRLSSIPSSLKFCIIRVEAVSHRATEVALQWVRRSPEHRTLAFCRGVSDVRSAAKDYKEMVLQGDEHYNLGVFTDCPTEENSQDYYGKMLEPVKEQFPLDPLTKLPPAAKPPEIEKADKKEEAMREKESFIVETVAKAGSLGIGMLDIRTAWEERYGRAAKSTVGTWIAKAIANGYVMNIGGTGRSHRGGGPKAAWYLSPVVYGTLTAAEAQLEPGTRQREAFDAHLQRLRGKPVPPPKTVAPPPPPPAPVKKVVKGMNASESITTECELLVLWLREWNVESMTISKDGKVVLASPPTKSPELRVSFTVE